MFTFRNIDTTRIHHFPEDGAITEIRWAVNTSKTIQILVRILLVHLCVV